jgi:hypothetical protein
MLMPALQRACVPRTSGLTGCWWTRPLKSSVRSSASEPRSRRCAPGELLEQLEGGRRPGAEPLSVPGAFSGLEEGVGLARATWEWARALRGPSEEGGGSRSEGGTEWFPRLSS